MEKKNVVVLGAGFGGLRAAQDIAQGLRNAGLTDTYAIILVDRNEYQIYTPELFAHAAATESMPPKNVKWTVEDLIKEYPIRFLRGEISLIDLAKGEVRLADATSIRTEFLVIALGSEANFFGIPGMRENVISLKTFNDAEKIRSTLAEILTNKPDPTIIVGGAGANGIELASQIKFLHAKANVTIVEAMPTILPGLDATVIKKISNRLARLNIKVMTSSKIMKANANSLELEGGANLPFDLMVWTGGIKAPDMIAQLPLKTDRGKLYAETFMGCLPQNPDLKLYPMVYVVGDSVCFHDPKTDRPMPAVASVAIDQAKIAAKNVVEEILQKENAKHTAIVRHYKAEEYPYVIPVGGHYAVAKWGPIVFSGWPAWAFKEIIMLDYLLSVMPFFQAVGTWLG